MGNDSATKQQQKKLVNFQFEKRPMYLDCIHFTWQAELNLNKCNAIVCDLWLDTIDVLT